MPFDWGMPFRPLTDKPRKLSDLIAEEIDKQDTAQADRGFVKPFIAGAVQGVGDLASDMTSPFSIATMAAGPLARGARGLGRIGGLMAGEGATASRIPQIGRRLSDAEKTFEVVDEAGRPLLNRGGYAGPKVTGKPPTKGTLEAERKLAEMKTPQKTRVQPPRDPSKKMRGKERAKKLLEEEEGALKFPKKDPEASAIIRQRSAIKHEIAKQVPQEIRNLRSKNGAEYLRQKWNWVNEELRRRGYHDPETGTWKLDYLTSEEMDFFDRLKNRTRMNKTIKDAFPDEPD